MEMALLGMERFYDTACSHFSQHEAACGAERLFESL